MSDKKIKSYGEFSESLRGNNAMQTVPAQSSKADKKTIAGEAKRTSDVHWGSTYNKNLAKEDGAQFNGTSGIVAEKRGHQSYSGNTAEGKSKQFNGGTEASIGRLAFESVEKKPKTDS